MRNECKPKQGAGESKKIVIAQGRKDNRDAVVRHVPPQNPAIKIPADWMHAPVADTPNNWVEAEKRGEKNDCGGGWETETFEGEINVSLKNGKIISATIDNRVEVLSRECENAQLSRCGPPKRLPEQFHPAWTLAKVQSVTGKQVCSVDHCDANSANWANLDEM